MRTRRQFFAALFATLVITPLTAVGLLKAPVRQHSVLAANRQLQKAYNRALSAHIETIQWQPRLDILYNQPGAKIGDTLSVRRPARFRTVLG